MTNDDLYAVIITLKDATDFGLRRVDSRLGAVEGRLGAMERRLDRIETRVESLEDGQARIRKAIAALGKRSR